MVQRCTSFWTQRISALFLFALIMTTFIVSLHFATVPPIASWKKGNHDDKISQDLLSVIETSENPTDPVDVIACLSSGVDWRLAKQAILRRAPETQILAFHHLLQAISLRTTVGELYNIAGLPVIHRLWADIAVQLDYKDSNPTTSSNPVAAGSYLTPQEVVMTDPLLAQGLNGSHTVVAILDTGIDITHPDLDDFDDNESTIDPKVLAQVSFVEGDPFPFDLNGHGTYCAGLIAGTGTASNGSYTGIAPGAQLLSAKVLLADGTGYSSWVIRGIEWSVTHGADIILLPFSTFGLPGDPLSEAVRLATEKGVLVVAAAGDSGPNHMTIMSPGESLAALTVGAYDSLTGLVAEFSSRGPTFDLRSKPDLVAPGVDIISCALADIIPTVYGNISISVSADDLDMFGVSTFGNPVNGNYTMASTTAASAAISSGVACLLLEGCRYATPNCLSIGMRQGAVSLQGEPNVEGHGLLNASAAFDMLEELHNPFSQDFRSRTVTTGLPYYGVLMGQAEEENVTLLMSTYSTAMAAMVQSNTTNMTMMHMLMGMFYLAIGNSSLIPFYFLDMEQEFHWTTLPTGDYTRATGILSYEDLLIISRVESWRITTDPPTNAFRITQFLLNIGDEELEDVRLYSLWNFDLFTGANNTSIQAGSFNGSTQTFHVSRNCLPPNESILVDQYIGFNTSTPLAGFEVGVYDQVNDHLNNDALNGSATYNSHDEIAVGTQWNLGNLSTGASVVNVTMTLGFGSSFAAITHGLNETANATQPLPLADFCLIRVELPRTGLPTGTYSTSALILNIGDKAADALAAFLTNQSQPMGGAIFSRYFQLGSLEPFEFFPLTVNWNPETEDVYLAAWIVTPEITLDWFNLTMPQDHYPLDNIIFRDVFISTPPRMRIIAPGTLPYGPMILNFPNDYAIYNLSLLTSTPIEHLEIFVEGVAADWVNVTPSEIDNIKIGTRFQLTIFIPSFLEAGLYSAEIHAIASDGWEMTIPMLVDVVYPKATILFDSIHNLGLDFTALSDLSNLDLEALMAAYEEMADSVLTGYSMLRELFAEAQLNLAEFPTIGEINSTILSIFDGIIICDPEKGFKSTELANLTQYITDGFKVIILADNADATNHTAINQLLTNFDLQLSGSIATINTTDLSVTSPFTNGVSAITTEGGTYLQATSSTDIFARSNASAIGGYQSSFYRELFVFGCSAVFANTHIQHLDNLRFANNTIHHLFRRTLNITISPTGGNGTLFTIGKDAGFIIDVVNQTGDGVEGLEVFVLYKLANGSDFYFMAFEVKEGRYGTFIFANWTGNIVGNYTIFVFTLPSNYSSTMAFMHFYYVAAPEQPEPQPEPDYFQLMILEITGATIFMLFVIGVYFFGQYRRRRRMRTPIIDEQLIQRIDNALNTLHALLREMEWTLTDRRLDRLDKLRFAVGETADRLDKMLEKLREIATETGV
ncbi:MAG: S8 family serine peptidase [Promethearchaeota archaeon]